MQISSRDCSRALQLGVGMLFSTVSQQDARSAEYCCTCLLKYVHMNSVVVNAHEKLSMMRQGSLQFLCEFVEVNVLSQKYVARYLLGHEVI